jgi:hypothetical protein
MQVPGVFKIRFIGQQTVQTGLVSFAAGRQEARGQQQVMQAGTSRVFCELTARAAAAMSAHHFTTLLLLLLLLLLSCCRRSVCSWQLVPSCNAGGDAPAATAAAAAAATEQQLHVSRSAHTWASAP